MIKDNETCTSPTFINPSQGIYQLISDLQMSTLIDIKDNIVVKTTFKDNEIDLMDKKGKIATFNLKKGILEQERYMVESANKDYKLDFTAYLYKNNIDCISYYLCCPRLVIYN